MTFSLFSLAILLIVGVALLIEIGRGVRRGFLKTLVSIATLLAALLFALIISPGVSMMLSEPIVAMVKKMPEVYSMLGSSRNIDLFLSAVISMLVSSILFLAVFSVLRLLFSWISSFFFSKENKGAEKQESFCTEEAPAYERNPKVWGAAAGAVCGILASIVVTSPIMGTLNITKDIFDIVEKADRTIIAQEQVKPEVDAIRKYASDVPGNLLYHMGGNLIYANAACTTVNGKTVYAVNEFKNLSLIIEDFLALYPLIQDPSNVTPDHAKKIDELCEHMEDIKLFDVMIAEFLPKAANAWLNGEAFMKITKPSLNEIIVPAFDGILEVCAQTTVYNVKQNTVSLLRIYSLLLSSGILQVGDDFNAILSCIERTDLLKRLEAELDKNPYMQPIKTITAEIAMRTLADQIYNNNFDLGNYADLTQKLADAISNISNKNYGTEEEMISAMKNYAQEYLNDYGISVPESVAGPVAEMFLSKIDMSSGNIAPEQIEELLKSYLNQ